MKDYSYKKDVEIISFNDETIYKSMKKAFLWLDKNCNHVIVYDVTSHLSEMSKTINIYYESSFKDIE